MTQFFKTLAALRTYLGFVVTMVSLLGLFILGFNGKADVNSTVPIIVGIYLGARMGSQISAHAAAAKDETCDTMAVVKEMNDK